MSNEKPEYDSFIPSADLTLAKIRQWARDRNLIDGSTPEKQFCKGASEFGELGDAIIKGDRTEIIDGIGDTIVVLTIIAAQHGLSIAECLAFAYNEIKDRKGVMYNGTFIKESDPRYADILVELGRGV